MDPTVNPFAPYPKDWTSVYSPNSWFVINKDDIERVYTKLWQETCAVVGIEKNKLCIQTFAEYWYTNLC